MDDATNYNLDHRNLEQWDMEEWLEISTTDEQSKQDRKPKKRRRPLRKNRKPSRPANYIGQRSNNHLLKIFNSGDPAPQEPEE